MGRWRDAEVGQELGPIEFELTDELNRRYAESTHNARPDLVDPTLAGNLAIRLLGARYPGSIIHSHQKLSFRAPASVGDTLTGTGTISLKEMRRDKAYVAADCEFRRDGELVWTALLTCVWPEVHLRGEE